MKSNDRNARRRAKQGALALQIHPEAFARLRTFIERAEAIFNPQ
jgi:hypothetical protein